MKLKNFPSWLKGIIITYFILIVFTIIISTIFFIISKGECATFFFGGDLAEHFNYSQISWCFKPSLDIVIYSPVLILKIFSLEFPSSIFFYLIGWILFGVLLGWVIGRRKSRK